MSSCQSFPDSCFSNGSILTVRIFPEGNKVNIQISLASPATCCRWVSSLSFRTKERMAALTSIVVESTPRISPFKRPCRSTMEKISRKTSRQIERPRRLSHTERVERSRVRSHRSSPGNCRSESLPAHLQATARSEESLSKQPTWACGSRRLEGWKAFRPNGNTAGKAPPANYQSLLFSRAD